MNPTDAPLAPRPEEPTLDAALRVLAYTQFLAASNLSLQLAIPAAFQFWSWGWRRSAGWMVVASTFGVWALCEQALDRDVEPGHAVLRRSARDLAIRGSGCWQGWVRD